MDSAVPFFSSFVEPPSDSRPMMRWWWFGPAVNDTDLDRQLEAMQAAGIGGVEVSYVYPLDGDPDPLGSEPFLAHLRHAADTARRLGLRFDLTLGSGWSFGGPHITPDLAARRLHWEQHEIHPGPLEIPVSTPWPGDELLAAYLGTGSLQEPPEQCRRLEIADGVIRVPDGTGTRVVVLLRSRLTGQNVKRAAAGAEGPVLDHYQAAATETHLGAFGDRLLDAVPAELVGSVFCDSLEVYEADWTPDLAAEFERRRGYPLLDRAWQLLFDADGSDVVRADLHQSLAELYEENFLRVVRSWAHRRGVPFRVQNYGTPPATVSAYRHADLFEGEGWGWKEITQTRWATSAAHLYGRSVVSSETWTWLHSPSFRATPLDIVGEAHEHFLLGINQLIGHGWPYSPAEADGLGWIFYASAALDDRNPWWGAAPALTGYLARLSHLLQQGEPVTDVAVYVPNRDLFAVMGAAQGGSLDPWHEAVRRIGTEVPAAVRQSGLDFDLVDDDAIAAGAVRPWSTVIVAGASMVPEATLEWLGGRTHNVLLVDSPLLASVPGAQVVTDIAAALAEVQPSDAVLTPAFGDVGAVHRRADGVDVYFLANTGDQVRTFAFTGRGLTGSYEQWDPRTARVVAAGGGGLTVTLHPYEATVVVVHDGPLPGVTARADQDADPGSLLALDDWTADFGEGPAPVSLPHVWEDDPDRAHFSGTVCYRTRIDLDAVPATARLQIGDGESEPAGSSARDGMVGRSYRATPRSSVREAVQVVVNGVDCGWLWAPPFAAEVGHALRPGANEIELRVANTAANALAADTAIRELAAASEQRFGRRFRMQQLGLATSTTRSGLFGVPVLLV